MGINTCRWSNEKKENVKEEPKKEIQKGQEKPVEN